LFVRPSQLVWAVRLVAPLQVERRTIEAPPKGADNEKGPEQRAALFGARHAAERHTGTSAKRGQPNGCAPFHWIGGLFPGPILAQKWPAKQKLIAFSARACLYLLQGSVRRPKRQPRHVSGNKRPLDASLAQVHFVPSELLCFPKGREKSKKASGEGGEKIIKKIKTSQGTSGKNRRPLGASHRPERSEALSGGPLAFCGRQQTATRGPFLGGHEMGTTIGLPRWPLIGPQRRAMGPSAQIRPWPHRRTNEKFPPLFWQLSSNFLPTFSNQFPIFPIERRPKPHSCPLAARWNQTGVQKLQQLKLHEGNVLVSKGKSQGAPHHKVTAQMELPAARDSLRSADTQAAA